MAYFPFFMDISTGEGLIVGGGRVALRKIEKLRPFDAALTVCAPEILPEIEAMPGLTLLRRPFANCLADGKLFVIAATDDNELNSHIAALCRGKNIPVNVVDRREECTFLFPALVKRGELTVGITTSGASPSAAVYWKNRIDELIPSEAGGMLEYLSALRETVKTSVPAARRGMVFASVFDACMERGWPLPEKTLKELLSQSSGAKEER